MTDSQTSGDAAIDSNAAGAKSRRRHMKNQLTKFARRVARRAFTRAPSAAFAEVERAEQMFYLAYLREGMTVFDAGTHVGELTLLFARSIGDGRVHAFEASSTAYARLEAVSHAVARRNIVINHLALADMAGTVRLHVYDADYLCWSTLAARPLADYGIDVKPVAIEEVAATTVDNYCEQHAIARIDLLKLDVEGAEFQVMQGARRMLEERRIGCLTFEFGQTTFDMGNHPDEIEAYLRRMGYRIRNLVGGDPVFPGRENAQSAIYSMHAATPDS